GRPLPDLSGPGGAPHPGTAGLALHAEAWQLAEHGRTGAVGAEPAVLAAAHPRPGHLGTGGGGLGPRAQSGRRAHRLALRHRRRPRPPRSLLPYPRTGHFSRVGVLSTVSTHSCHPDCGVQTLMASAALHPVILNESEGSRLPETSFQRAAMLTL